MADQTHSDDDHRHEVPEHAEATHQQLNEASDDSEYEQPPDDRRWRDFLNKCGPDCTPSELLGRALVGEKAKVRVNNVTRGRGIVGEQGMITMTKVSLMQPPPHVQSKCMSEVVQACAKEVPSFQASRALWMSRFHCNLHNLSGRVKVSVWS